MFRGFATVSFYADDLSAAREWYAELFGLAPYYAFPHPPAPPAYLEFRVGDDEDELGIIDRKYAPQGAAGGPEGRPSPGGAVVFWHVDDLPAIVEKLLAMGAAEYEPVTERESGFTTASFVDPFGNILGVMHNPHFLEMLDAREKPETASGEAAAGDAAAQCGG
ncbi:VOC family protein [Brevibacterium daeguense]|uniref:VOC family protein n=1 Tax=Brevibacterium daeguense TaxID=909936 RepID=A0ABP8EH79_9MICO|nr:VOC family protein [Brevibacterium daeguense]